jgi:hypothetical protein
MKLIASVQSQPMVRARIRRLRNVRSARDIHWHRNQAEGTLLIGASATWGEVEAVLDLLNGDTGSSSTGWYTTVERKAEADVELSAEASLGLPVGIGVEISVLRVLGGGWSAGCELTDTRSISAEARYSLLSVGGHDENQDDDGSCDGIIGLRNTLDTSVTELGSWGLIEPWDSEPLADGCIQLGKSGDGGDNDGDDGDNGDDREGGLEPDKATCVAKTMAFPKGFRVTFQVLVLMIRQSHH